MTFLCPCVFKCSTLGHNKYDWVISELSVLPELRTLYGFKECPPWFDDPRPAASVCLECSSRWGLARFPLPFEMTSQPSLDRASRASSLLIPWRLTTLISAISDWFVGVASSQKDRGFETWQIIKGSPLHLWYVDKERTEQMGTSESLLPRTHILLIFSLMRDFRRLLENTLNLFQRSLQQSFLLHCSMLGQTLKLQSVLFFFLTSTITAVNENCVLKAVDETEKTLSLHALAHMEIEHPRFLNRKWVLLCDRYESVHGRGYLVI